NIGTAAAKHGACVPPGRDDGVTVTLALLLTCASPGCSTVEGGSPSPHDTEPHDPTLPDGSADSTGDGGADQPPPQYGDQCGPGVTGWETLCTAWSTQRSYTDPLMMTAVDIEDELGSGFAKLCCEGIALEEEADGGCQDLCIQRLCEEARQTHMWWALDVAPACLE